MRLYGDCETFSLVDLTAVGGYRYAADPSTGLNCFGFAMDAEPVRMYPKDTNKQMADYIRWFLEKTDGKFVFHNALFELAIIKFVLDIEIPPSRVIDTMAKLGYYGYPRKLDDGAKAVGCSKLKDIQKKKTMLELAACDMSPKVRLAEFETLYSYCRTDVEVTREIDQRVPDLPEMVQRLWELDIEINMRGVPLDVGAVRNAVYLKDQLATDANRRMGELTGGAVPAVTNTAKIQEFARSQGVEMGDCTADTVRRLLVGELPEVVRAVLQLRREAGLSSLAKYDQMLSRQVGGRLYHEFDNYGCTTGRPKGRGVQTLNMPRATESDYWADLIGSCPELLYGVCKNPPAKVKEGIRGMVKAPPGKRLVGGDLSQIEARATGYAANDQKFLGLFTSGRDPYCEYGPALWGHTITKADMLKRTACKATVLQMGFVGGIGAFQRGAESYDIDMNVLAAFILPTATPAEVAKGQESYHKYYLSKKPLKPLTEEQGVAADIVKQRYRRDFPRIVAYWDELWAAFLYGGQAGPVTVEKIGTMRRLTLPSGRQLFYHDVRLSKYKPKADDTDDESEEFWTYQARDLRKKVWKGVTMENVAQAINHDVSTWYMLQANENIAPVIHQCYDEFTMEVDETKADWAEAQLKELVKTQPAWSKGLPIAFETWQGVRYG